MTTPIGLDERAPDDQGRPLHLRRISVRGATIVGGVFSAILGFAFLLAGWFVVAIAAQRGVLDQINSVSTDLSSGRPTHLGALQLCVVWTAIVIGWTVAMTAVIGLAAMIFNAVLRLVGGIELDLSPAAPARAEVFAPSSLRLAAAGGRLRAWTAKRLHEIDWSLLTPPRMTKPVQDGADLRRSNAARARSLVDEGDKG